jgi:hypothetical protein
MIMATLPLAFVGAAAAGPIADAATAVGRGVASAATNLGIRVATSKLATTIGGDLGNFTSQDWRVIASGARKNFLTGGALAFGTNLGCPTFFSGLAAFGCVVLGNTVAAYTGALSFPTTVRFIVTISAYMGASFFGGILTLWKGKP